MNALAPRPTHTPEDLLAMPDGDRYELVDGTLVEREMGAWASYVGTRLLRLIANHSEEQGLGWTWGADCGYQCFPSSPSMVRKPDVSFLRLGRLPGEQAPDGHIRIPPDLVGEVLSPNNLDSETDRKVEEYLAAGVRLVWVVSPSARTILIYRADGSMSGLREQDELNGEDVIPGFRCRVGVLFVTPGETRPATAPSR